MREMRAKDAQTHGRTDARTQGSSVAWYMTQMLRVCASARLCLPWVTACLLLAACSGSKGPTPLVVYSPHGRDQLTAMEKAFEAKNPDIDVRWLDMGSQ